MRARPSTADITRRRLTLGIVLFGLLVLSPALDAPRHRTGDWGPHHLLTRALARGLAAGHVPRYLIGVSTGDSPYETYPFPTYGIAAGLTLATGDERNAPAVLALLGVLAHVGIAAAIARLALHVAPAPLAGAVGMLALFDVGSFESGAAESILEVGLLHAALAQCLALLALDAVLDMLRLGARRANVLALWVCAGTAAAFHPSGLIFTGALLPVLFFVAAVAKDVSPRRALIAAFHLAVGITSAALVFAPFTERMLRYGLHVASPAPSLANALDDILALRHLRTSWPLPLAIGYVGLVVALARRRAAMATVGALGTLLLLASTELPHRLLFDWLPSTLARWQCFRFVTLARPLIFVSAAGLIAACWRILVRRAPRLCGTRLAAGTALACGSLVTIAFASSAFPPGFTSLLAVARSEVPDPTGFASLVDWATREQSAQPASSISRALWDGPENAGHHLAAESGMPVFALGEAVGMMLRERIENRSPESLRRFNVRFIVFRERAQWLGDAKSERHFGSYNVRELLEWDGQLARIEKGAGRLRITRREDERIDVELRETDAPALVALGLGYYPRWRASRTDGTPVPVFALPATPGGSVRVIAAWLGPGTTSFSADGPLPSDGKGLSGSALSVGIGALVIGSRWRAGTRRPGRRLARLVSRGRTRSAARVVLCGFAGGVLLLAGLPPRTDPALRLVRGFMPAADVEARAPGEPWRPCEFSWLRREFECAGLGRVSDATAYLIKDHLSSTAFLTPAIVARSEAGRVEYRVRASRAFAGRHWAASSGPGGATLLCGTQSLKLEKARIALELGAGTGYATCELTLRTRGRNPQDATLVRQTAIDDDRTTDVPWAPADPKMTPSAEAR